MMKIKYQITYKNSENAFIIFLQQINEFFTLINYIIDFHFK